MKNTINGVQINNSLGNRAGDIFFDSGHMYITVGTKPISIKNIDGIVIEELGHFFYFFGRSPERAATRIDFSDIDLSVRIDTTIIYFIHDKQVVQFDSVAPSELKKLGTWLKNRD
jgi:hypothetical protein